MKRLKPTFFLINILAVVLLFGSATANSAVIPWKEQAHKVSAQNKPLGELLRELASRNGVVINVANDVKGAVNGTFDMRPQALLELLAANFGFVWYYDGALLKVTSASDIESRIISLDDASVGAIRSVLNKLRIVDRRYPVVFDASSRIAKVSGPSRYVALISEAIQSARFDVQTSQLTPPNATKETAVRVVPLTYAWAKDFEYVVGGRTQLLPGVATIMNGLYNGSESVAVDDRFARRLGEGQDRQTLDRLISLGVDGERIQQENLNGRARVGSRSPSSGPKFVAEGRMNAVLVRDAPERLDAHERAIRSLDVKPGLVEIEARIIEVNSDEIESLGIDWRFRDSTLDIQSGAQPLPSLGFTPAGSELQPGSVLGGGITQLEPSPNGVLTTVLGDAGRFLIARVSALADDGKANLLSSPKLLTLDNVEAAMEDIETFFVRVAGNLEVDLFDVSVGTTLRVTPLIVEEGARDVVKLAITIEDGRLNGLRVDDIPTVRRSRIRTQAIVGSGQALLIAGYTRESDAQSEVGVPGLSSIPGLGWLFKTRTRQKQRVERLFLLTPKVVTP